MKKTQRLNTALANLIFKVLRETKNGEKISNKEEYAVLLAVETELLFLKIFDYLRKENHWTYFRKRYLSIHNKMTQESLAMEYGMCRDTASAYCKQYMEVFKLCLDVAKKSTQYLDDSEINDCLRYMKKINCSFMLI